MTQILPTNIFWGEHRTSELLAMNVKSKLESDKEISAKIPFVEYTEYQWTDYIELLLKKEELVQKGATIEEFDEIIRTEKDPELKNYEEQLHREYGPVSFNLHDGVKLQGYALPDIAFWIPSTIQEDKELSDLLINIGKKHNLNINTRIHRKDPKLLVNRASTLSIIVELYQPTPEETMHYSSKEIEQLALKYTPAKQGPWYFEQNAKTEHPIFIEAVNKYSTYLKDALLAVKEMNLTLYSGALPRLKESE